jgi:hypothetical protein
MLPSESAEIAYQNKSAIDDILFQGSGCGCKL